MSIIRLGAALLVVVLPSALGSVNDLSADQLITRVLAGRQSTGFRIHARLVRSAVGSEKPDISQLLIKGSRNGQGTQVLYQVLWPKSQSGQILLVSRSGDGPGTGFLLEPPQKITPVTPQLARQGFFGTDLSIEDVMEDFWHWPSQTIVGEEKVNRQSCVILESRPAAGLDTSYSRIRSWIVPDSGLPLRLEKFDREGQLIKRLTTERFHKDSHGRSIPATLVIESADGLHQTRLEGTKFEGDLEFPADDFTVDGIMRPPRGTPSSDPGK